MVLPPCCASSVPCHGIQFPPGASHASAAVLTAGTTSSDSEIWGRVGQGAVQTFVVVAFIVSAIASGLCAIKDWSAWSDGWGSALSIWTNIFAGLAGSIIGSGVVFLHGRIPHLVQRSNGAPPPPAASVSLPPSLVPRGSAPHSTADRASGPTVREVADRSSTDSYHDAIVAEQDRAR